MTKLCLTLPLFILLTTLSACTLISHTAPKIALDIAPFYHADGPVIQVGQYSTELATNEPDKLMQTSQHMRNALDSLKPEQMYVAAVRLYELDLHDEALYWFYQAQYRARLYNCSVNKEHPDTKDIESHAAVLARLYRHFYVKIEPYFSEYARCNVSQWLTLLEQIKQENTTPDKLTNVFTDIPFNTSEFQQCNTRMINGLAVLVRQIKREQAQSTTNSAAHCNNSSGQLSLSRQ